MISEKSNPNLAKKKLKTKKRRGIKEEIGAFGVEIPFFFPIFTFSTTLQICRRLRKNVKQNNPKNN